MPYEIRKKGRGYVVVNTASGKEHSTKGVPKARAEAQMRLLYMIENGMVPRTKK
jgi:hypothetical protein